MDLLHEICLMIYLMSLLLFLLVMVIVCLVASLRREGNPSCHTNRKKCERMVDGYCARCHADYY